MSIATWLWWTCLMVSISPGFGHLKLNVPRVRLPYFETISVNFTLYVDTPGDGCYLWSVSRSEIITLSTEKTDSETGCSNSAVISSVPRSSPCCPATAIVYVEDAVTKEIVRCDIIVDKIHSLSVVTTTKELHLEEAPSKFHVRGQGNKGDEFSTLDGVPIKWHLESASKETTSSGTGIDPQSIMRFLPFSESLYQATPGVSALEGKRLQGSTVLVEGIKTGSVFVSARLSDSFYKNVPPAKIRIVVVANLNLDPVEANIVPGSVIPLKLKQLKHGRFTYITLPSPVYEFEVTNTSVVSYDPVTSEITALAFGETIITVKDKNCIESEDEDESPQALTAHIRVVQPKFLSLSILPYRNWALVINHPYEINVEVFDSENQKITITDNVGVDTTFESKFFRLDESSDNGTWHAGVPIQKGTATVKAVLRKIRLLNGDYLDMPSLPRVKAEMEIFQNVALNPKETILPWDPNVQPKYELRWNPSGGNGNFFWSSTNSSVLTVLQNATGKTEYFGFANVTAAATVNQAIKGQARVYVLPPKGMEIVKHIVEAEVGTPIQVPLAFYTVRSDDVNKTRVSYSSCGQLPFEVEVEDPQFHYDAKTHYPHMKPACTVLPIVGNSLGSSLVTVTYKTGNIAFQDSVIVSTFKPLKIVEPASGITVLAVGSSKQLAFVGGPRPLLESHAGFFRKLNVTNTTVVNYEQIKQEDYDDLYVYEVLCKEIGETDVALLIGNNKTSDASSNPVLRVAVVTVVCADPAQMFFKVETATKSKCPKDASAQVVRVAVPNYEETKVSVTVKDSKGRRFDNITSLHIKWTTSPNDLLGFSTPSWVETEVVKAYGYTTSGKSYQILEPTGNSGNVEITGEIMGYRDDVLRASGVVNKRWTFSFSTEDENEETKSSMDLLLVGDVSVHPSPVNVFNHPSSTMTLRIRDGSGHFEVQAMDRSIFEVSYSEERRTLDILPKQDGTSLLLVRDLCLPNSRIAEVSVRVSGAGRIDVDTVDKIQVGNEVDVKVRVFDHAGALIPAEMLALLKLELVPVLPKASPSVELHLLESDPEEASLHYRMKGTNVGQATITFMTSGLGGRLTKSIPRHITVFPPLTLQPKDVKLLVDSVYQVLAIGGPQPDCMTQFSVDNSDVVHISGSGILNGRALGRSNINAKAVDNDLPQKVYSRDHGTIQVVTLKGIRIHMPLSRVQTDTEMPLWVMGTEDDLEPLVLLGGLTPVGSFDWLVSNRETGEIIHAFQDYGHLPQKTEQLEVRFRAKKSGHVTIRVIATINGRKYTDEKIIEVYEQLKLLDFHQSHSNLRPLLMSPNSELVLRTNRDSGSVTYALQNLQCLETNGVSCVRGLLTVDTNGILRSSDATGHGVVVIKVVEDFGVTQILTVDVEVKKVVFIKINPVLPIMLFTGVSALPQGLNFKISITAHDNTGHVFDAANFQPKIRPNRYDLIQINPGSDNNSFVGQTLSEGRVVIKVYDEQLLLSDFLILSIDEVIAPEMTLGAMTVGDIVCFTCGISSADGGVGFWQAEPKGILKLEPSGNAVAISPGNVRIEYRLQGIGAVASSEVTVMPVTHIKFSTIGSPTFITNGDYSTIFDVIVNLGDSTDNLLGSNCSKDISGIAPFSCDLQFVRGGMYRISDFFTVQPVFIYEKELYACRITPIRNSTSIFSSTIDSRLSLTAKITGLASDARFRSTENQQMELQTPPLVLPFYAAVYVDSVQLDITTSVPEGKLFLTGIISILNKIKIIPSHKRFVYIKSDETTSLADNAISMDQVHKGPFAFDQNAASRSVVIAVYSDLWISGEAFEGFSVTVVSQSTNQSIKVPIIIRLTESFPERRGYLRAYYFVRDTYQIWLITPMVVLATLLALHCCSRAIRKNYAIEKTKLFVSNTTWDNISRVSSKARSPPFDVNNSSMSNSIFASPSSPNMTSTLSTPVTPPPVRHSEGSTSRRLYSSDLSASSQGFASPSYRRPNR